jgi:hypothetical protein
LVLSKENADFTREYHMAVADFTRKYHMELADFIRELYNQEYSGGRYETE